MDDFSKTRDIKYLNVQIHFFPPS